MFYNMFLIKCYVVVDLYSVYEMLKFRTIEKYITRYLYL
jgi:hypothetical protein